MNSELNKIGIFIVPHRFRNGYTEVGVRVVKDGQTFEQIEIVEDDHFKSLGELCLEKVVRAMRNQMGWKA